MREVRFRGLTRPETLTEDGRLEVIAATDRPVKVFGVVESLLMTPEAIATDRLDGLPVLADHDWSAGAIVGRADGWRIEALADGALGLVLSIALDTGQVEALRRIREGLWRDVSLSYAVHEERAGEDGVVVVTRWEPLEVSFVAVPADPTARARGMTQEASVQAVPVAAGVAQGAPSHEAEAKRGGDPGKGHLAREADMEKVDLEARAKSPEIVVVRDETVTARSALVDEIAASISGRGRLRSLTDAVCRAAAIRGESIDPLNREVVMRAATHVSGDFPLILGAALNKAALSAWEAAEALRWWEKIGARYDFRDGRPIPKVSFEGFGLLPQVTEGDDYAGLTSHEAGEVLTPRKYGGEFRMTEEMRLADDLGLFGRALQEAVRAGIRRASAQCLAALTTDTLRDGKTAVHVDHGNRASTAAAPSAASLAELEGLLLNATDAAGNPIGLPARYLLAPPSLRQAIEGLYRVVTDPDGAMIVAMIVGVDKANRFYVPGLTGTAYYLLADDPEVLIYGYLQEHGGPRVTEYPAPAADALIYHITLWFGAVCGRYQRIAGNAGA